MSLRLNREQIKRFPKKGSVDVDGSSYSLCDREPLRNFWFNECKLEFLNRSKLPNLLLSYLSKRRLFYSSYKVGINLIDLNSSLI